MFSHLKGSYEGHLGDMATQRIEELEAEANQDANAVDKLLLRQWCIQMAIERRDDATDIVSLAQEIYDWVKK
jgi:hypothetical protein